MAEAIVKIVTEQVISAAADWLKEEIFANVEMEVDNISSKMQMIQKVLDDAANKSVTDDAIKEWLEKLKDISYELEDVLDEWNTNALKQKNEEVERNASQETSYSNNFTCLPIKQFKKKSISAFKKLGWRRDIVLRIKVINEQVNSVFSEMKQFKLISKTLGNVFPTDQAMKSVEADRRMTTSFVNKLRIYGRDAEKDDLLWKLLSGKEEEHNEIEVISIIGVGGLGKTTLAKLVYNDKEVEDEFQKRIWVCVSDPFEEIKVAQRILECIGVYHNKVDNLQTLHESIASSLNKQKFLLVLDDVWDEKFGKWDRLRTCLESTGASKCRILVTTRSEKVARIMGTKAINMFWPGKISDSECWSVMSREAFNGKVRTNIDEFQEIGMEIAKKCNGLPLAAMTLGGLLLSKDTIEEWKLVLSSELWEMEEVKQQLFPHLFISYREFPSCLKRCFIFCASFPKDYIFDVKNELIFLWMSHGYLNQGNKDEEVEQIGQEYFKILVSFSFLQESTSKYLGRKLASMHDIMHDFGLYLSGNEFLTVTEDDGSAEPEFKKSSCPSSSKVRSLLIDGNINPKSVCEVGKLRAFGGCIPESVAVDMFGQLKLLRTLILRGCDWDQIPEDIGKLIHLRTLDLSHNSTLKSLPETLGDLYNLRYLILEKVEGLSKLPKSIGKLVNLRYIIPDIWLRPNYLEPESLGKLINIRSMKALYVNCQFSNLGYLMNLNRLRGELSIHFESGYIDVADAKKARLRSKKHVKKLVLQFNEVHVTDSAVEALQSPPNIEDLEMSGCRTTRIPGWITSLNNLTTLTISKAPNLLSLPPLGKLPSLKKIQLCRLSILKFISREFMGIRCNVLDEVPHSSSSSTTFFPKLVHFAIMDCDELKEWEDLTQKEENTINLMPKLKILHIENCPKLEVFPRCLLQKASCLSNLSINLSEQFSTVKLKEEVPNLYFLKIRSFMGPKLPSLMTVLDNLAEVEVIGAENVLSLPPLGMLPSLEKLRLEGLSLLKFIGQEFWGTNNGVDPGSCWSSSVAAFPKLIQFILTDCHELEELAEIYQEQEKHSTVVIMPKLEVLQIDRCPKLEVIPYWLIHKASCLRSFSVFGCELLSTYEEIEKGMTGDFNIQLLKTKDFMGKKLPGFITSFDFLTEVQVIGAANVLSLPPLGIIPSLEKLRLEGLSLLKFIGREFWGTNNSVDTGSRWSSSVAAFPKLVQFILTDCHELEELAEIDQEQEHHSTVVIMPKLEVLQIDRCPKLEEIPCWLIRRASCLKSFSVSGCEILSTGEEIEKGMTGSLNIQLLKTKDFRGKKLPGFITSFDFLREVQVIGAKDVLSIPPFGMLPSLEKLQLEGLSHLKFIGREFWRTNNSLADTGSCCSSSVAAFPKLVQFILNDCHELEELAETDEELEQDSTALIMPKLEVLQIDRCPKLDIVPCWLIRKASCLKSFSVSRCELLSTGEEIGKGMVGSPNIQLFRTKHFMGTKLPGFITSFDFLTEVQVIDAASISSLPPLWKLPSLKKLHLERLWSFEFIGRDFMGIDNASPTLVAPFPKLVQLVLKDCYKLNRWEDLNSKEEHEVIVMPSIEMIHIENCPNLDVLQYRFLRAIPSLKTLKTIRSGTQSYSRWKAAQSFKEVSRGVVCTPHKAPKIQHFVGTQFPIWITYSNYLRELEIYNVDFVSSLPALGKLPSLEKLYIRDFPELRLIGRKFLGIEISTEHEAISTSPSSISAFPKLEELRVNNCRKLEKWEDLTLEEEQSVTVMPKLQSLKIEFCPNFKVLPHRLLLKASSLEYLEISSCGTTLSDNPKVKELFSHIPQVQLL